MADVNPPIGGDLSGLTRAAQELEAAAAQARAAARHAQQVGAEPSRRVVEQEAARTRAREQTFEKPLSDAARARQRATVDEARALKEKARAEGEAATTSRRSTKARTDAEQQLADEYKRARRRLSVEQSTDRSFAVRDRLGEGASPQYLTGPTGRRRDFRSREAAQAAARAEATARAGAALAGEDVALQREQVAASQRTTVAKEETANAASRRARAETATADAAQRDAAISNARRALPAAGQSSFAQMQRSELALAQTLESRAKVAAARDQLDRQAYADAAAGRYSQRPNAFRPAGLLPPAGGTTDMPLSPYRAGRTPGGVVERGGGGGVPPRPPGGSIPLPAPGDDERRARQYATASREAGNSTQFWTQKIQANNDAMRRHGALTTEFIQAAARGEANYREWGYQIGATAGKFAGWTAVSIPVFAALDGIRKIGAGAIESSSGVNQLQRVINNVDSGDAQSAFRDLSREFNVPIEVAARAVYLSGQRFHDLGNAVDAARASLSAFKTGELDVDEATTRLNAVARAFGMETGAAVAETFDQVNQAQNRLGARIPDLVAGLATAGGAFRNAGGDVTSLINLLVTGTQVTGRTGNQIATAVQRSAGYVLRPSNQTALRGFGINPNQPFYRTDRPSILGDAVAVAKQLIASGREGDITRLATALSTPQFASIFTPILRQGAQSDLLARNARIVSPEASRDSAQRELAILLGSPKEQLAAFGNQLERLGSALGESGLVTAITTTAGAFGLLIGGVERILNLINSVPPALSTATFLGAGALGGRAIGRRLGVGEERGGLMGGIFGRSDEQNARIATRQALRENQQALQESARTYSTRARNAAIGFNVATRTSEAFETTTPASEGMKPDAWRKELLARRAAAEAAESAKRALANEAAVLDEMVIANRNLERGAKEAARTGRTLAFAEQNQIWVTPTQDRPTELAPGQVIGGRMPDGRPRGPVNTFRNILAAEATSISALNATQGRLTATAATVERGMLLGAGVARRTGTAIKGAAASIYGFIGPFGAIFLGLDAAMAAEALLADKFRQMGEHADRMGGGETNVKEFRRQSKDRAGQTGGHGGFLGGVRDWIEGGKWSAQERFINERERTNRDLADAGKPLVNLSRKEWEGRFNDINDQFRRGAIDVGERAKAMRNLIDSLDRSADPSLDGARETLRSRGVNAVRAKQSTGDIVGELLRDIGGLDVKQTATDIEWIGKLIQTGQAKVGDARRYMGEGVALAARLSRERGSYHGQVAYEEVVSGIATTLEGGARTELQRALGAARSQKDRDQAYEDYNNTLAKADDDLQDELRAARRRTGRARDRVRNERAGQTARTEGFGQDPRASVGRLEDLLRDAKKAGDDERDTRKALRDIQKRLRELRREISGKQRFQERDTRSALEASVNAFDYTPGVSRDTYLLDAIGERVRRAIRKFGSDSDEALNLIQQQRQQQQQVVQDQMDLIGSRGALYASQTRDPAAARTRNIATLHRQLAFARQHPKQYGEKELADLQTQINQARNNAAEEQKRQIDDLLAARYALRIARTDDPVERARLELQRDKAILNRGGFGSKADRLRAQADVANSQRSYRDARLTAKEEDIDFDRQMERITTQDAIDRYQALLNIRNLSKAQRRDILQKIKGLQKEAEGEAGSFDLDVGSIKMPTIYDVRRAFDPIRDSVKAARDAAAPVVIGTSAQPRGIGRVRAAASDAAMSAPTFNNTVNVFVNDKNAAGEVYEQIDRAMKTTVKAKMRSRRHR